ncbi:MAG: GNAT family N-acetyltransferase [Sphingobacteriales bacterium]|nr:GNAT family N-acetyltransferase [Sphingobacteriales bacterium]
MSEFICRDYQENDYPSIEQLWVQTGVGNPARGDNPETIENTLKLGGKLIVLEEVSTKKITGTSWLTVDGRRVYLHHFAILPEYQGKKLSWILLKESLAFAKKMNLQIKLEVHKNNLKALRLYEKAGFRYLGDYLVYIIRNLDEI